MIKRGIASIKLAFNVKNKFAFTKKKFVFANNIFKNSNVFKFFKSLILTDKKIVTHLTDNCQMLKR